ncbi:hypothetical protein KQH41_01070, partial [bacterium]|nr:hypothetical protein [bacterium]
LCSSSRFRAALRIRKPACSYLAEMSLFNDTLRMFIISVSLQNRSGGQQSFTSGFLKNVLGTSSNSKEKSLDQKPVCTQKNPAKTGLLKQVYFAT